MQQETKFRNWGITYWFDTDLDLSDAQSKMSDVMANIRQGAASVRYMKWVIEKAEVDDLEKDGHEMGANRMHAHALVQFENQCTFNSVRTKIPATAHLENIWDVNAWYKYVGKVETRISDVFEWGTFKADEQGKRNDILEVTKLIEKSQSTLGVARSNPVVWVKYHKGLTSFCNELHREKAKAAWRGSDAESGDSPLRTIIVSGPSGSGKTSWCHKDAAQFDLRIYTLMNPATNGATWFDHYEGEEALLIDDYHGWLNFDFLLKVLDGYCLQVQTKGSTTYARWTTVYLTSTKCWEDWHPNMMSLGRGPELERRIRSIVRCAARPSKRMRTIDILPNDHEQEKLKEFLENLDDF